MKHFINDIYSKRLKLLRHQIDATQGNIEARLGMCQQAYSKLEKGKTNFTHERIRQICRIFKIQEKEFVLITDFSLKNGKSVLSQSKDGEDIPIDTLNRHYEILLLESELRNIKLEQKVRNYKPFQENLGSDLPLIYVMI